MSQLTRVVIEVLLTGSISTSRLADGGNFFVNANAGQAGYRIGSAYDGIFDTGLGGQSRNAREAAGALRFGYRWHSLVDYGIEAGYADFGHVSSTLSRSSGSGTSGDGNTNELTSRGGLLAAI